MIKQVKTVHDCVHTTKSGKVIIDVPKLHNLDIYSIDIIFNLIPKNTQNITVSIGSISDYKEKK